MGMNNMNMNGFNNNFNINIHNKTKKMIYIIFLSNITYLLN